MSYWSLVGAGVGAVAGVVAGIYCPPAWGVTIPAGIAAGSALGGATGGAVDSSNAADEAEAKQKQAAEKQSKINEEITRRQKKEAYTQAANTNVSSETLYGRAAAIRKSESQQVALAQDYGHPLKPMEKKAPTAVQLSESERIG